MSRGDSWVRSARFSERCVCSKGCSGEGRWGVRSRAGSLEATGVVRGLPCTRNPRHESRETSPRAASWGGGELREPQLDGGRKEKKKKKKRNREPLPTRETLGYSVARTTFLASSSRQDRRKRSADSLETRENEAKRAKERERVDRYGRSIARRARSERTSERGNVRPTTAMQQVTDKLLGSFSSLLGYLRRMALLLGRNRRPNFGPRQFETPRLRYDGHFPSFLLRIRRYRNTLEVVQTTERINRSTPNRRDHKNDRIYLSCVYLFF